MPSSVDSSVALSNSSFSCNIFSVFFLSVVSLIIPIAFHFPFILTEDRDNSTGNSVPSFFRAFNSSVFPTAAPFPVIWNFSNSFAYALIML